MPALLGADLDGLGHFGERPDLCGRLRGFAVIRSKCATPFRMIRCATLKPDQSSNRERRMAAPKIRAHFIEPMLLVRTESLFLANS
jgi:hypothetical protein